MTTAQTPAPSTYADHVADYALAGWPCVIPVPPATKTPPPVGFTGAEGRDTDPATLVRLATEFPGWSIALRMPWFEHDDLGGTLPGGWCVIGIDVDQYEKAGKQKHGAVTLADHVARWGPLMKTWTSTARGEGLTREQPSRIHLFRAPARRYATLLRSTHTSGDLVGSVTSDVEIIQRHHRYAVVWPSEHHDAGALYTWYDPEGRPADRPPRPDELAWLPPAWVEGLAQGAAAQAARPSDVASGGAMLDQLLEDWRPECADMTSARLTAVDTLERADEGSRHERMTQRTQHLVQLAASGHPGVAHALLAVRDAWARLTEGEDREGELDRALLGAARIAVTNVGSAQVPADPCLMFGFEGTGAPLPPLAPGDPGSTAPPLDDQGNPVDLQIVAPPQDVQRWAGVRQAIGAAAFDPVAGLDQSLAEAVLARTYPALRYAFDANAWLLRVPDRWELHRRLSPWAVSQVAQLMPVGDPTADKDSDQFERSRRRARFMTSAGAKAIASMMDALVTGGMHPASVALAELDADPEVLWAGGMPYSLRDSLNGPAFAQVDVTTPHLHTAGVLPEVRPTPLWDAFLEAVWPDAEVRRWAVRVLSVAFTGYADRALPILIGDTGRGKTQLLHLLMSVLGTYGHAANPKLLSPATKEHDTIVFDLKGRRLSFIDEAPSDAKAGQERLKQLTGGGELTGRQMNQDPVTFRPTHTLVLTSNDEPLLTDPAVRARARLVPCEGDPELVRLARAAIGHVSGAAWRAEAPGVLATMMAEAAGWLADPTSALTAAAPESIRYLAENLGAEQDPVAVWLTEETEPFEPGTASRELYQAFTRSCMLNNIRRDQIPSETKWGHQLSRMGYPWFRTKNGKRRQLRVSTGGFLPGMDPTPTFGQTVHPNGAPEQPASTPISPIGGPTTGNESGDPASDPDGCTVGARLVHSSESNCASTFPQVNHPVFVEGCTDAQSDEYLRTYTRDARPQEPANPDPAELCTPTVDDSALTSASKPASNKRREQTAKASETRAAKTAAARLERIAAAGGPQVRLPAIVTTDAAVRHLDLADVDVLLGTASSGPGAELTVDVETTGYWVGHEHFALRTVQLGNEHFAVVLDAADPEHKAVGSRHLAAAPVLHAHSATADLVPLGLDGWIDLEEAWGRMHDTVVPAKLSDPAMTGSDPSLKKISAVVLGAAALSPHAEEARSALFKAGQWLTETKPTSPVEKSGWAQVDSTCETMVRYAASDVIDDAAIARRLSRPDDALLERERLAQRMTARIAAHGLPLDGARIVALLDVHRPGLAEAGDRLRELSGGTVENPGSDQQVAEAAAALGAQLPRTRTGRLSVAKGAIEQYTETPGPLGDFVRARLDYQRHENALGLFLEPYDVLVKRGDGRARPTVYTLSADTGRMSCLQSDALIEMPRDLAKNPGGIPISEVKAGDWVYAFDHDRELVLKRVKWCAQTGVRETVTVTAENSAGHRITLRATPEHLFRLRNGDWRAAGKLLTTTGARRDGVRLMPMVRRQIDDGYVKFFPHSIARQGAGVRGGGKSREHRWVLEQVTGRRVSTKADVNHIDGNRANNHPGNLEALPVADHRGNRDLAWGVDQPQLDLYSGPTDYRVVSVTPGLVEPVWDMEVEDVHNFIANGVCVHNCVRPNFQQLPREGGFRACITADPGHLLISVDFAQVELRVAAALSGDRGLQAILADPTRDVHREIAQLVWGPTADKGHRYQAKRKVFGRIYGQGVPGMAASTPVVSIQVAQAVVNAMDALTPGLTEWSRMVRDSVSAGRTKFPTYAGRVVHLDPDQPHKAPNYCIQGTAREFLIDALVRWSRTRWGQCVMFPVHDEVVAMVPEHEAEEATAVLVECMTNELYGVPILAEPSAPAFAWQDAS